LIDRIANTGLTNHLCAAKKKLNKRIVLKRTAYFKKNFRYKPACISERTPWRWWWRSQLAEEDRGDITREIQEIWANAHETRDSISLISYAGCLGLSALYFSENSL